MVLPILNVSAFGFGSAAGTVGICEMICCAAIRNAPYCTKSVVWSGALTLSAVTCPVMPSITALFVCEWRAAVLARISAAETTLATSSDRFALAAAFFSLAAAAVALLAAAVADWPALVSDSLAATALSAAPSRAASASALAVSAALRFSPAFASRTPNSSRVPV